MRPESNLMESWRLWNVRWKEECWWNVRWNGVLLECSITFAERLKEYSVQAVVEPYARCCSMFKIGVLKGFSSVEVDLLEAAGTSA